MSLKTIHLVFVAAVILMSLGLAVVYGRTFRADGSLVDLGWAIGWAGLAVGMVVYGRRVVRKLRRFQPS